MPVLWRILAALSLLIWGYLLFFRGRFWRMRDDSRQSRRTASHPPRVAIVIPARDEAAVIGAAVTSLTKQTYNGEFHIFVVDDHSADDTAGVAREAGGPSNLTVTSAGPLPPGWTGKLWAVSQGIEYAQREHPHYYLLTDADIVHDPNNLQKLVIRAQADRLDLASYMVKLRAVTAAERLLIPAFVYFFLKLYPPAWIADPARETAGAAGGCILIRRDALERIGGIASIRSEVIDDCALARAVKRSGGKVWMGLTASTRSVREYQGFGDIGRMISRTAFTQLKHSPILLLGTIAGMLLTYVAPSIGAFTGDPIAGGLGGLAWAMMSLSYIPTLRFYNVTIFWAPLLPLIALFYTSATVLSAIQYWTGAGGSWKGRIQDPKAT